MAGFDKIYARFQINIAGIANNRVALIPNLAGGVGTEFATVSQTFSSTSTSNRSLTFLLQNFTGATLTVTNVTIFTKKIV